MGGQQYRGIELKRRMPVGVEVDDIGSKFLFQGQKKFTRTRKIQFATAHPFEVIFRRHQRQVGKARSFRL